MRKWVRELKRDKLIKQNIRIHLYIGNSDRKGIRLNWAMSLFKESQRIFDWILENLIFEK